VADANGATVTAIVTATANAKINLFIFACLFPGPHWMVALKTY